PQLHVKLEQDGNRLVGTVPGVPNLTFYPYTDKDFYTKGQYLIIHFQKDDAGKVTGCQVESYSGGFVAKKVN
ncbi:MAG: hypothetical protein ACLP05_10650, partial [Candidatus Kryptoniota bacterium]